MTTEPATRGELVRLAREALGPDDGDSVVQLALPAALLEPGAEPRGRSRLGGRAVLEESQPWPHWGEQPLSLIAVVDLEDFAGIDVGLQLPRRGLLNVFYEAERQAAWGFDPAHAEGWRIVPADPDRARHRARPDGALEFADCPLGRRPVLTLPDRFESVLEDLKMRHGERVDELIEQWDELAGIREPHHQLGGWPRLVQNPIQMECQLASNGVQCGHAGAYEDPRHEQIRQGAADWRLLLQLDSDDRPGWVWGDWGSLYYCLSGQRADADALRAAWMVLQCG